MEQKFLDETGVVHLYKKLSLQDYPNNEILIGVISAIDETKADKTEIPTKISELENDNNYLVEETDPTVPDWAKSSSKPTYTYDEVGADEAGASIAALVEAKSYTDTAVADLVNSAPETLDTLGELAVAFEENADMVATLDAAVTNKAEKTDLDNLADLVDINATNIESLQTQILPTSLILADAITGESYTIQIQNGQLVSFLTSEIV